MSVSHILHKIIKYKLFCQRLWSEPVTFIARYLKNLIGEGRVVAKFLKILICPILFCDNTNTFLLLSVAMIQLCFQ